MEAPKKKGRPKLPPRAKFQIDIDQETLEKARQKRPDLHAVVVDFIRDIAED